MRTFIGALRYEWIRLRSVRSTWALVLAAIASAGMVAWIVAREITRGEEFLSEPETVVSLLSGSSGVGPLSFPALFAGLIGVAALGTEYRHGLMQSTLTAVPRRGVLLTAKLLVVAAFAALTAVLSIGSAYAVGRAEIGPGFDTSLLWVGDTERALGGFVVLVVLTSLLGVALGALLRSATAAGVVLVALPALIEPLAIWALTGPNSATGEEIASHLPFTAGAQMVNLPGGDGPGFDLVALSAMAGGLTFLAFVLATTVLSSAVFARRDA
jgi:ABC-2 type transport system permease protein